MRLNLKKNKMDKTWSKKFFINKDTVRLHEECYKHTALQSILQPRNIYETFIILAWKYFKIACVLQFHLQVSISKQKLNETWSEARLNIIETLSRAPECARIDKRGVDDTVTHSILLEHSFLFIFCLFFFYIMRLCI